MMIKKLKNKETKKTIEVEISKLKKLIECYNNASGLCSELNIYEWREGNKSLKEMDKWVDKNFGEKL